MKKKNDSPKLPLILALGMVVIFGIVAISRIYKENKVTETNITKPSDEQFAAPGKDWISSKKVEDYFISSLHMTPEEANTIRSKPGVDGKIMLRLTENTTLDGLLGNLEYYGFVRDQNAFKYALENTTDTMPGRTDALKIGTNTIDLYSYYRISEEMSAWEIADELLNRPTYFAYDEYQYLFMP